MAWDYYTGDTESFQVTFTQQSDGTAYDVSGTTIKCAIRKELTSGRSTLIAGPWTCSSGATGADWANGVVIATIDGTDTGSITPGRYYLEVNVDDGGDDLTRVPKQVLNVKQRTIP